MVVATDLHRVYIQMLLARRAMPAEVALEMYKRAVSAVMREYRKSTGHTVLKLTLRFYPT
jgi:hypothetical protein